MTTPTTPTGSTGSGVSTEPTPTRTPTTPRHAATFIAVLTIAAVLIAAGIWRYTTTLPNNAAHHALDRIGTPPLDNPTTVDTDPPDSCEPDGCTWTRTWTADLTNPDTTTRTVAWAVTQPDPNPDLPAVCGDNPDPTNLRCSTTRTVTTPIGNRTVTITVLTTPPHTTLGPRITVIAATTTPPNRP